MDITIREYIDSDLEPLNILLYQVYKKKRLGIKKENNIELIALKDNKIVGYLILSKNYDVIDNIIYGYINYVCVLEQYRNHDIATKLLEKVFEICKQDNIKYVELTSNKHRVAANNLYTKLEFKIRDTNVFRKEFL